MLCCIVGPVMSLVSGAKIAVGISTVVWPSVPGTVLEWKVEKDDTHRRRMYGVKVRYAYEVGDRTYEGDRYQYGYMPSTFGVFAPSAPKSPEVTIRYFPSDPRISTLKAGFYLWMLFPFFFGILFLLAGYLMYRELMMG